MKMFINNIWQWLVRIYKFNRQMFPLFPNVFVFFAQFTASYLTLLKLLNLQRDLTLGLFEVLIGSVSLMLFSYLFRCFDEVKDYESDKINFPDRPLVKGVVSIQDMLILQGLVIFLLIILNVIFIKQTAVHITFVVVLLFTIGARFWFFAERWIKPSLPLALLTHNPVVYLHQLYVLSYFTLEPQSVFGQPGLFLFSIGLLGTTWEISRKIRGTQEENSYTTYSKVWGPVLSTWIVVLLLVLSFICQLGIFSTRIINETIYLWILPALVLVRIIYNAFTFSKKTLIAPPLRQRVEEYAFSIIAVLVILYFFG